MLLDRIGPPVEVPRVNPSCHPYARARARPWSARCYGVARQRDRSRQNSRGPALTPLVTLTRARGPGRGRPAATGRSPTRSVAPKQPGPALTPLVTLTRARGPGRGRPAATGSLANAIGRAKTAGGLGRASLRHFGLARGCRGIWRGVISVYWFRGELRFIGFGGAMLLDRIGPPVEVPRVNPSCHPYARARARPWSARCYGVARQRDRSRQNSRGPR